MYRQNSFCVKEIICDGLKIFSLNVTEMFPKDVNHTFIQLENI